MAFCLSLASSPEGADRTRTAVLMLYSGLKRAADECVYVGLNV